MHVLVFVHRCSALWHSAMSTDYSMTDGCKPNVPGAVADDSCISEYIEIVPLDTTRNLIDADDIKQEILEEIKQEPDEFHEVCDIKDAFADAQVWCWFCFVMSFALNYIANN